MKRLLNSASNQPLLAVTPGEPAGIGPDIVLASLGQVLPARLLVVADPALLKQRALALGLSVDINDWQQTRVMSTTALNVMPVSLPTTAQPGKMNTANAAYVLQTLEVAVQLCEQKTCHGIVTGPVNKAVINDAGIAFTGHTEWLANRLNTPRVVMMLATQGLRVALATTHLPLRSVADAINKQDLAKTITILDRALRERFHIRRPRIMVCGLNPHAGEGGYLGMEEIDIIIPLIEELQKAGIDLTGPIPADTAFNPKLLAQFDVVLAMYHDQGLPVLKHKGFGDAVNVTLGLPIIRTSVDHGTALDLAASGKADPASLFTAIRVAAEMANPAKREY
jgi:4-hydroxythreonine-4-phosphate dehydrogenase